jgi:hypothetical protein
LVNARDAGTSAFTSITHEGRFEGRILGEGYLAHRVIFLWMQGRWPDPEVDHVDHDPLNNKWDNLREATRSDNTRNMSMSKANTSGRAGVFWDRSRNKWAVDITIDWRAYRLGRYDTFEEACAARAAAEKLYGFHPNHGKARTK